MFFDNKKMQDNMKYKIITIHCIPNFGSILQTYALAKFLKVCGKEVEIIDYRPFYYFKGRNILRKLYPIVFYPISYFKQKNKVDNFCAKNINVSSIKYEKLIDLKNISSGDDVFISGGDQLWNSFHPCGNDDAYKLVFVDTKKKLAYGTSMGRTSFTASELEEISQKLKDFYSIGLREQSTVPMLQKHTNVPVKHVADPVLLLDKKDYMEFVGSERMIKEPYMLVYMVAKSDLLNAAVEKISRERNLKIVHVSGFGKKCKYDYKLTTGPEELLNLIYYAEFVLSASFHATLFSVLFNKQFCTLLPEAGTNVRIEDILSYLNLEDRIIHSKDELIQLDAFIEYEKVNKIREKFAKESRDYLIDTIKKVENL